MPAVTAAEAPGGGGHEVSWRREGAGGQVSRADAQGAALLAGYLDDEARVRGQDMNVIGVVLEAQELRLQQRARGLGLALVGDIEQSIYDDDDYDDDGRPPELLVRSRWRVSEEPAQEAVRAPRRLVERVPGPDTYKNMKEET